MEFTKDMEKCYSYIKFVDDEYMAIYREYANFDVVKQDPGVMDVVPIMGFFGKFAFVEEDIRKYEFTDLEILVLSQVLSADEKNLIEMKIEATIVSKIRRNFNLCVPALFARRCSNQLPSMVIDKITEKMRRHSDDKSLVKKDILLDEIIIESSNALVMQIGVVDKLESTVENDDTMDNFILSDLLLDDYCDVLIIKDRAQFERTRVFKKDFMTLEFKSYDNVIPREVMQKIFEGFNIVSFSVLSRVSKRWYMILKNMEPRWFPGETKLPNRSSEPWHSKLILSLRTKGFIMNSKEGFYNYVLSFVRYWTLDMRDFVSFLRIYSNRELTTGLFLLLSILYVRSHKTVNYYDEQIIALEKIYYRLSIRDRDYLKNKIKCGTKLVTTMKQRIYTREIDFDGISLKSDGSGIWNGYRDVYVGRSSRRDRLWMRSMLESSIKDSKDLVRKRKHHRKKLN